MSDADIISDKNVLNMFLNKKGSNDNKIFFYFFSDFEINIVLVFQDDHLVTENFPLKLTRF